MFKETIVIMKKQNIIIILLIVCVGVILTSCGSDNSELEAALAAEDIKFTVSAGDDQSVKLNDIVQLNANKCFDPDGNPLDYLWEFVSTPNGSITSLLTQDIENPTFNADIAGLYKISLTVYNGIESKSDEVEITVNDNSGANPGTNTAPVANAGNDFTVTVNNEINLNGTGSYDDDPGDQAILTFSWSIVSGPDNYSAAVISFTLAEATFTPDMAGVYEISLTVNDGKDSHTDTMVVTANTGPVTTPGIEVRDHLSNAITDGSVYSYGSININTSDNETFTIQNNGTANLVISGISFIAGDQSEFILNTTSTNMTVPQGNSTTFTATFQPNSGGTRSAVIRIQNNASTIDFTVQGHSITSPDIQVRNAQNTVISNGGSFNYVNTNVYSNTPTTFTIHNTGTANLSISAISLVSGDTNVYAINTSGMNSAVLPNQSTSFSIMFSPTFGGINSAIVRISNNDETHEFTVTGFAFDFQGITILDSLDDVGMYSSINVENGRVYICYYDETNGKVKFARSFDAGLTWNIETIPYNGDVGKGSSMAVDGNNIFISTTVDERIGLIQSVNSGTSWNTIQILPGETRTYNGDYDEYKTSIAVDGNQIFISYLTPDTLILQIVISDSYNPFTNWTNNNIYPPPDDFENGYYSSMHALNGKVYLSHSGYMQGDLYFTSGTDSISDPFTTQLVDQVNVMGDKGYTSLAYNTIGTNVHFYIAYYDQSPDNQNLKFARSINNGNNFSLSTIDNTSTTIGKYPSIAVSQDTIYVCYYDETNQNLKFARSSDYGVSWDIQVVDDSSDDVGSFTSLAVEGSSVYISYYDLTNKDLKFAKSIDSGNTWN